MHRSKLFCFHCTWVFSSILCRIFDFDYIHFDRFTAFALCESSAGHRLRLSHFANGSLDTSWSFRTLRMVLLTPVEAFALCEWIFNAIFVLETKVVFYRLFVPDEYDLKPVLIYQKNNINNDKPVSYTHL